MKHQVHQRRCSRLTLQNEKGVQRSPIQEPFQVLVYGKCGEVFKMWSGERMRGERCSSPLQQGELQVAHYLTLRPQKLEGTVCLETSKLRNTGDKLIFSGLKEGNCLSMNLGPGFPFFPKIIHTEPCKEENQVPLSDITQEHGMGELSEHRVQRC